MKGGALHVLMTQVAAPADKPAGPLERHRVSIQPLRWPHMQGTSRPAAMRAMRKLACSTHSPDRVPHPCGQRLQQQLAANLLQRLQAVLEQLELAVHQREAHRHCGLALVRRRPALNRTPGGGERRLAERRRSGWWRGLISQESLL